MAVVSWTRDFTLTSSLGDLVIPAEMLDPNQSTADTALRITTDTVPGQDGATFHRRFKNGYQMTVALIAQAGGLLMLGDDLQEFYDTLMGHLDALIDDGGRISWTPDGADPRMLDAIQTLQMPLPSGMLPKQIVFAVESPFPYAITAAETDTELTDGMPVTISRGGSAKEFFPVFEVAGPVDSFTVRNNTTGLQVGYDSSQPGASSIASSKFAELDHFRKTVVNKPSPLAFLEEGVVWLGADFFPLVKGDNEIEIDGASGTMKWNEAWA